MNLAVNKIASEIKVTHYDFDPDVITPVAAAWVDMRDFSKFMASFFRTVGTSAVTMIIQASAAANGANPETIVTKTVSAEPNAVGDYIFAECMAQQIAQVGSETGKALRYVSATISVATNTDEGVVTYVMSGARFPADGLTEDYVS
jgi:hypothetical protein